MSCMQPAAAAPLSIGPTDWTDPPCPAVTTPHHTGPIDLGMAPVGRRRSPRSGRRRQRAFGSTPPGLGLLPLLLLLLLLLPSVAAWDRYSEALDVRRVGRGGSRIHVQVCTQASM